MKRTMRACCVPECGDKTSNRYNIPSDKRIYQIWIDRIGNSKLFGSDDRDFLKNYVVCDRHFGDICKNTNGRLLRYSLPTLHLPAYNGDPTNKEASFSYPAKEFQFVTPPKVREALLNASVPLKVREALLNASLYIDQRLCSTAPKNIEVVRDSKCDSTCVEKSPELEPEPLPEEHVRLEPNRHINRRLFDIDSNIMEDFKLKSGGIQESDVADIDLNDDEVRIFCLGEVNDICRLCLATQGLYTLIESPQLENFREISQLDIKLDENLPSSICESCLERLEQFQQLTDFINQCRGVQKILHKLLESGDSNIPTIVLKEELHADITVIKDEAVVKVEPDPKLHQNQLKKCQKCGEFVDNLVQHRRTNAQCRWLCKVCGISVATKNCLRSHLRTHKLSKPLRCDKCGKTFKYSRNLNRHKALHDFGKQYQCDICRKEFTTKLHMQAHRNIHTGEKPIKCKYCDEQFPGVAARALHHRKIHGVHVLKPKLDVNRAETNKHVLCFVCGNKYKTRAALNVHFRKHEGKYLTCDQCSFRCIGETSLTRHRRIHTGEKPYHCDQCPKTFRQSSHLNNHLNAAHAKTTKYKCDLCAKTFNYHTSLKEHQRRHRGEMWYNCHVCQKGFYSSSARKTHVLQLHGSEEVDNIRKNVWRSKPHETSAGEEIKDEKMMTVNV